MCRQHTNCSLYSTALTHTNHVLCLCDFYSFLYYCWLKNIPQKWNRAQYRGLFPRRWRGIRYKVVAPSSAEFKTRWSRNTISLSAFTAWTRVTLPMPFYHVKSWGWRWFTLPRINALLTNPEVKGNVFPAQAMQVNRGNRQHSRLTSAQYEDQWLTWRPGRFILRKKKKTLYPLNKKLGGPQSRYGYFEEEKNILPYRNSNSGPPNP